MFMYNLVVFAFHALVPLQAFNINKGSEKEFGEPGRQSDSLFGWSLAYFKEELYVSAPRALTGSSRTDGEVYTCSKGRGCSRVARDSAGDVNDTDVWFGATLVSEEDVLYTCAPRSFQPLDVSSYYFMGSCFTLNSGRSKFELTHSFQNFKKFNFGMKRIFLGIGIYGFSAVVDDAGVLRVGAPNNPQTYPTDMHRKDVQLYSGVVVESYPGGETVFPDGREPPPYTYTGQQENQELWPNLLMAGYSIGKGRFSDGPKELIISAPGASFHKGRVYVCGTCNKGGKGVDQVLEGDREGEGFGQTAVACDINGDGKDDLIVGSPLYAPNNRFYDTGRVHVYTNKWNRIRFNLVNTTSLGVANFRMVSGAMFGKALACLGDTDGDGKQEVVVGAPFYKETGAVFVFKSLEMEDSLDTEPSQIVEGKAAGFGLSFAVSLPYKDGINFQPRADRRNELTISSPYTRKVFSYTFRDVIRFNDSSQYILFCYDARNSKTMCNLNIDPETKKLELVITPIITTPTSLLDLTVTAKVAVGNRIASDTNFAETVEREATISKGKDRAQPLVFGFKPTNKWTEALNDDSNLDNSIKIKFQMEYRIPCLGECAMFPKIASSQKDRKYVDEKTVLFESMLLKPSLSACKSLECDCTMQYSLQRTPSVSLVSGGQSNLVVGQLFITNDGPDLSHSNKVSLQILTDNTTELVTDKIPAQCQTENGMVVCHLKLLMRGESTMLPLEIRNRDFIKGDNLKLKIEATSICSRTPYSETIELPVSQEWKIETAFDGGKLGKFAAWREQDPLSTKEKLQILKHTFQVKNVGPSVNSETDIFIFLPNKSLLTDPQVTLNKLPCTEEGDLTLALVPPQPPTIYGEIERLYCERRAECTCLRCTVPAVQPNSEIELTIETNFSILEAENSTNNIFYFATGIISLDYRNNKFTSVGLTTYQYESITTLEQVLKNYDIILALVVGFVILIIIIVIFTYFDVFNKVRIFKNRAEEDDNDTGRDTIDAIKDTNPDIDPR